MRAKNPRAARWTDLGDDGAPGLLAGDELLGKVRVDQQVLQRRVPLVRLVDVRQEHRADDAPALCTSRGNSDGVPDISHFRRGRSLKRLNILGVSERYMAHALAAQALHACT